MKIHLRKINNSTLITASDDDIEKLKRVKAGAVVSVELKISRNYRFLKKFFAMLDVGFDAWEPDEVTYKGHIVAKNKEQFREDVTIMAGYGELMLRLDGSMRTKAKSIAFGSMSEDEFEKVYNAVSSVLLAKVLRNYTKDDLERVVNELIGFI